MMAPPAATFFDAAHWESIGAVTAFGAGRGAACMFLHEGREYVLRHYRRGGWIARLSADRYWWSGLERTRPWREWHLLADLHGQGLPVPRPAAARVQRSGRGYRADLVMERIAGAQPLADLLAQAPLSADRWIAIGATIRRLHEAGVCHADLNARNILLVADGDVFIIDFDKAERRPLHGSWREGNLMRLHRSLDKLRAAGAVIHYDPADWDRLLSGYGARG